MNALFWTQILLCLSVFIQSLEMLALQPSWDDRGIWRWQLLKKDFQEVPSWLRKIASLTLPAERFQILLFVRLSAAALFPFFPHWILMVLMLVTSILVLLRWRGAFNGGSDFMTLIVLLMMTLTSLFPNNSKVLVGSLWYVALQTTLSYFLAGYAKLKQANWRRGNSIAIFLQTTIYQPSRLLGAVSSNRFLCFMLTWMVLLFELSFPILFLRPQLVGFYLVLGFLFHLANAYLFGLNRFLLAWIATYPALYFCAHRL